jgi:hypothetical protein
VRSVVLTIAPDIQHCAAVARKVRLCVLAATARACDRAGVPAVPLRASAPSAMPASDEFELVWKTRDTLGSGWFAARVGTPSAPVCVCARVLVRRVTVRVAFA